MAVDTQLMTFSETDLAWAAGFIDGEGSIGLYPCARRDKYHHKYFFLRLSVANTDIRCLRRLQRMFGGSINRTNHNNRPEQRPCWTWYCQSKKCADALERLLPFLLSKKEQAETALLSRKYMRKKGQFRLEPVDLQSQQEIASHLRLLKKV